mgnify:CR=1 FL=1
MRLKRKISLLLAASLLAAVTVLSGWMIYDELSSRQKEKEDFDALAELVEMPVTNPPITSEPLPAETVEPSETTEPEEPLRDLSPLFEQNSECIGWLCIPNTAVNYPVMHTPKNPQKYLRMNFYGEYSQSGVPFLDYRCSLDSGNLLIYGHNMKNGTMFGELKSYTDPAFCADHPIIELQTADGLFHYTVSEVKITDTSDKWYEDISGELFEENRCLVLSTCYGGGNRRLLIIATEIQ